MTTIRRSTPIIAGAAFALLIAGTVAAGPGGDRHGRGTFVDVNGNEIGHVRLSQDRQGDVRVVVTVQGLTPGLHGIHIHAVAGCTAPLFADAGGHYNPMGHEHGLENPAGPHAGDLPNLVVDADGHGHLNATTDRVTLTDGPATLFDVDGSALIIHANPDDQVTNIGNGGSGARIACAVVERS